MCQAFSRAETAMKKRWLLRLGLLAGLALFGFWLVLWWTAPAYRINEETFSLLQPSMTDKEIVRLIGVPPGDYRSRPSQFRHPMRSRNGKSVAVDLYYPVFHLDEE